MGDTAHDERIDRIVEAIQQTNILLEGLRVSVQSIVERSNDHEVRLRVVERWLHNLSPILAALTFILGVVFSELVQRTLFRS